MRTLEVSLWFCPKFYLDISKKFGARTAKPSKNLRNQRLLGSQKIWVVSFNSILELTPTLL